MTAIGHRNFPSKSSLRYYLEQQGIQDTLALDLIEKLLALDPTQRIDAFKAVGHAWFDKGMAPPEQMPKFEDSHELSMKNNRIAAKKRRHPY